MKMKIIIKNLIIDKQDNLKKIRKFHKKLNKIVRKYIDFLEDDITILYEDGEFIGLELDIRHEFDNVATKEYREKNKIVISFDK